MCCVWRELAAFERRWFTGQVSAEFLTSEVYAIMRLRRLVRASSMFLCLAKLCLPRLHISATRAAVCSPNVIGVPSV